MAAPSIALLLAIAMLAQAPRSPQLPPELTALRAKANLTGDVTAWCRAHFRPGAPVAFAIAVVSEKGRRYAALDSNGSVTDLATFAGDADLSCYSRAEAAKLSASMKRTETVVGGIAPQWDTTTVCGFVDATTAQCWQYSPVARLFVQVGGWTT